MAKIFVLDTNIILHDHNAIRNFQENDLVIPIAVIEELDKFKKGNDALSFNARAFMREINKLTDKREFGPEGISLGKRLGRLKIEPNHPFAPEFADLFRDDTQDRNTKQIFDVIGIDDEVVLHLAEQREHEGKCQTDETHQGNGALHAGADGVFLDLYPADRVAFSGFDETVEGFGPDLKICFGDLFRKCGIFRDDIDSYDLGVDHRLRNSQFLDFQRTHVETEVLDDHVLDFTAVEDLRIGLCQVLCRVAVFIRNVLVDGLDIVGLNDHVHRCLVFWSDQELGIQET